jgi:hypothetical protein
VLGVDKRALLVEPLFLYGRWVEDQNGGSPIFLSSLSAGRGWN